MQRLSCDLVMSQNFQKRFYLAIYFIRALGSIQHFLSHFLIDTLLHQEAKPKRPGRLVPALVKL